MKKEEIRKLIDRAIENYLKEAKESGCDNNGGYPYATGCLSVLLVEALKSLPEDHLVFRLLQEE